MGDGDEMSWPEPNHRQNDERVEANNQENLLHFVEAFGKLGTQARVFSQRDTAKGNSSLNTAVLHYCLFLL